MAISSFFAEATPRASLELLTLTFLPHSFILCPSKGPPFGRSFLLGGRPMVGRQTLDLLIEVRILAPQPLVMMGIYRLTWCLAEWAFMFSGAEVPWTLRVVACLPQRCRGWYESMEQGATFTCYDGGATKVGRPILVGLGSSTRAGTPRVEWSAASDLRGV